MAGTTTSQFGRRGVDAAAGGALRRPEATGASTALQAATGWNRTAPALPADMVDAIARANRSLKSGRSTEAIERGPTAPAPGLMTMLFSCRGRVCRRDYWLFNIAASVSAVLAILAAFVTLPALDALLVAAPVAMVSVRIRSCLRIKRWHDRDKSAAWTLVGLIPFVGWLWTFLECGLMRGTPGPNRYGLPAR